MVDKDDTYLQINITYEKITKEIKLLELISINELKKQAMENFKIPENKKNFFSFSYLDKENNLIPLDEKENEDLFDLSNEVSENLYILNLNMYKNEISEEMSLKSIKAVEEININKEEEDKTDDNKNEELKNSLLKIEEENNELNKKIHEMKQLKIKNLENEIKELKARKEKRIKKKKEKEEKLIELKNEYIQKIDDIKKQLELEKMNKFLNGFKDKITKNIESLINEKLQNIFKNKIDNIIKTENENVVNKLKDNINNEMQNNIKTINNDLDEINNNIEEINKRIKLIKNSNKNNNQNNQVNADDINDAPKKEEVNKSQTNNFKVNSNENTDNVNNSNNINNNNNNNKINQGNNYNQNQLGKDNYNYGINKTEVKDSNHSKENFIQNQKDNGKIFQKFLSTIIVNNYNINLKEINQEQKNQILEQCINLIKLGVSPSKEVENLNEWINSHKKLNKDSFNFLVYIFKNIKSYVKNFEKNSGRNNNENSTQPIHNLNPKTYTSYNKAYNNIFGIDSNITNKNNNF